MPDRRDGLPIFVPRVGTAFHPKRLEFQKNDLLESTDLRDFIFNHPECLPITEIDRAYSPLVGIETEIDTDVGPIDCMFISPNGLVTIVETKLWKNPDARRAVVAQIIDYAKEVSRWSYSELNDKCRRKTGESLWQRVVNSSADVSHTNEHDFCNRTARSLRDGRFLLLVVGDGIKEDVERMVEYLQGAPQLLFSLHLIELQFYELPELGRIVIPQIVARTNEVTRAVIEIRTVDRELQLDVTASVEPQRSQSSTKTKRLTEAEFINQLEDNTTVNIKSLQTFLEQVVNDERIEIDQKTTSFVIKARDPVLRELKYSLAALMVDGQAYVDHWALTKQLEKAELPVEIATQYVQDVSTILGTQHKPTSYVPIAVVLKHRSEVMSTMLTLVDKIWDLRQRAEGIGE